MSLLEVRSFLQNKPSLNATIQTSLLQKESNEEPKLKISIIIPFYNEESNLSSLMTRLKIILNGSLLDYELLLINDGSIDKTGQIIKEEERKDPRVKSISYKENKGKGYAVRLGVLNSEGDIVLFFDGDLDISPDEIKTYIRELEESDLVIASKAHPLSQVTSPVQRRFLSKVYSLIVRGLVGIKLRDTQSGLKGGSGPVLRKIFEIMVVKGYAFDVEFLAIASTFDISIRELPVKITLDSSFNILQIARMFVDTLKISYRLRIAKYYHKILYARASSSRLSYLKD
jgi:glycosyltransferase involved in cell wall biosynthesis